MPRFSPASRPISAREAVDDVLLHLQPARRDPLLQLADRRLALIVEVHHDEPAYRQPLDDDEARHAARTAGRRRAVVGGHRAATGDAAVQVHLRQAGFEDAAADVVEVDVDALGRRGLQRLEQRLALVVDAIVEAELVAHPVALLAPA
ncbi:MAG TPA: hypothetical protein PKA20_21330, partial [Burkholderiaceae bacterium]|nr:hypothetical protein [Burkholderiaceae bacterium]